MNFILPNEQNKYPRYCNVNNLLCLFVVEGFVVGAAGVEFGVCAEVYYVALLEDDNLLHVADCAEAVGYDEHRAVVHKFVYRLLDKRFAVDIEGGSGFVQDNQRRIFQEYARDCNALLLSARKSVTALANAGVVAVFKLSDEVVRERRAGCRIHFLFGGVGLCKQNVVVDCVVKKHGILRHGTEVFVQVKKRHIFEVDSVNRD